METIIEGTPHIPIAEAAAELRTTPLRILMLIKQDVMKGCQLEEEWYVDRNTLGCFRSQDMDQKEHGGCGTCSGCQGK